MGDGGCICHLMAGGDAAASVPLHRGVKKCFWMGVLTLWWPNLHVPTPARGSGGMLPQEVFCYLYALKSILGQISFKGTPPPSPLFLMPVLQ